MPPKFKRLDRRTLDFLIKTERRFYLRDHNGEVVANYIASKRRAITLYQVPVEDSDLWYCGRNLSILGLESECTTSEPASTVVELL